MSAPATETVSAGSTEIGQVVLRAVGISKTYGVTKALKGVDFEVRAGQVTVLFGENGAGKSTLMKILSGVEQPTGGQLVLHDEPITLENTVDAVERGVSIIHQETNLCPNLNVRDNIFLGRELRTRIGGIDYAGETEVTSRLMRQLEEEIAPQTLVADLRMGQQQIVEIARALAAETRILIMDEPTSALSASEVEVLFRVIRELTANGVAIVYISHHLEEAISIADHAVVLRDGELVAHEPAGGIDLPWVVHQMTGRQAEYDFRDEPRDSGEVALSVRNLTVADHATGRVVVDGVSIDVRAGEIVCLYGLMGAGRTELMETLAGRDPMTAGEVLLNGENIAGLSVGERISRGLGLVPEDRQRDGVVQLLSVGSNLSLAGLRSVVRKGLISRVSESGRIRRGMDEVTVKAAGPDTPITSLSGGNQQKVVIGKLLMTDPTVLLLDEPTRGIDVGAKGEIFALLFKEAQKGLGVLYVTSEIGEAMTASHRIVVMHKGRIVREFDPRTSTRAEVMAASGESASPTTSTPTTDQAIGGTQ
ncbi:sugar ABC transporter ATP-binding protein [Nocardioides sp. KC13]|uniref:Sugar ABC transporter ATP-binding protein n=1 Tax=Nocardioides turkmenicus TaxID=2711220 RepID=A0A6M1R1R7_9ACTN|nr:sugar ABC transporter ATP-binding protein [Nocardioides sp. KC13]NGN93936.1 sugar ABC transporter ATP-binding protein [Nocardioides sp. KC13]